MHPGKASYIFPLEESLIRFSGNFDSGNLKYVTQITPFQYEIQAAFDSYQIPSTNKTFFHFFIEGGVQGKQIQLTFKKLALLIGLKQDAYSYRPFRSFDSINYSRLSKNEVFIIQSSQVIVLNLKVLLNQNRTFYSFALPYSYQRYLNMVRDLPVSNEEMYIHKQVLCYSKNLNLVYAITITGQNKCTDQEEKIGQYSNTVLLPQKHLNQPKKFFEKPVILISSRVHPGQTPASWAVQGMVKYLTSQEQDAKMIRKQFQVIIVPMLNPDGVEEGLYRLDTNGHNLNRYYLISDNRQPSIYCMKHLIKHYYETKRLLYYFDIHGHPSQKGSFLYGNALEQLPFQVQTQLFARLLSLNCPTFEEKFCIFDKEQMNSKDKYDQYTKEGCARVFAFKTANILHSYTLELGFHGLSNHNNSFLYNYQQYYSQGRAILTSVLMSCGIKDLPKDYTLKSLRKQLASQICNREERFRRQQRFLNHKKQQVNEIVEGQYWKPIIENHFSDSKKSKLSNIQKKRFPAQKRQSYSIYLQSFYSEEATLKRIEKKMNQRTSLGDLFEQNKVKIETNNIYFNVFSSQNSLNSINTATTKGDLEAPIQIGMPRLLKIPTKTASKQINNQPPYFRDKFRSLRKVIGMRGDSRSSGREQQQMFCDMNLREQNSQKVKPAPWRNKIHSLFIQCPL